MRKLVLATALYAVIGLGVRMWLPLPWQPPLIGLGMMGMMLALSDPRGSDEAVPAARNVSLSRRLLLAYAGGLCVAVSYGFWLFWSYR